MKLEVIHLGLIDYQSALEQQIKFAEKTFQENVPGYLMVCTHPPVVTTGRKTQPGDVFAWDGKVIEVARGGRATYHGPSQLVIYPIVNLKTPRKNLKDQDVWNLIRLMEKAIVQTLAKFDIQATGKSTAIQDTINSQTEDTGVWVDGFKIASIGIGVKNWVSYHGLALNIDEDPMAFTGMNPCGFKNTIMTSVEKILKQKPDRLKITQILSDELQELLK